MDDVSKPYTAPDRLEIHEVRGGSMGSTLPAGARVAVKKASPEGLVPGDIVVMRATSGETVLHRFIGRLADGRLITRGDAIARADPPWEPAQLMGRVSHSCPPPDVRRPGMTWMSPRRFVQRRLLTTSPLVRLGEREGYVGRAARAVGWRFRVAAGRFAWRHDRRKTSTIAAGVLHLPIWVDNSSSPSPPPNCCPDMSPTPENPPKNIAESFDVQRLGEEWAIYNKLTGSVHLLNATAGAIWKFWSEGLGVEEIVTRLQSDFPGIPEEELKKDVVETTNKLTMLHQSPLK